MATNKPQDAFVKTALRLPRDLHTQVHESARKNGRSFNSEIIQRLENSFFIAENNSSAASPLKIVEMIMQFATTSPNPSNQLLSLSKVLSDAANNIKAQE